VPEYPPSSAGGMNGLSSPWGERVRLPARVPPRRGLHPGGKSLWLGEVRGK